METKSHSYFQNLSLAFGIVSADLKIRIHSNNLLVLLSLKCPNVSLSIVENGIQSFSAIQLLGMSNDFIIKNLQFILHNQYTHRMLLMLQEKIISTDALMTKTMSDVNFLCQTSTTDLTSVRRKICHINKSLEDVINDKKEALNNFNIFSKNSIELLKSSFANNLHSLEKYQSRISSDNYIILSKCLSSVQSLKTLQEDLRVLFWNIDTTQKSLELSLKEALECQGEAQKQLKHLDDI
jgi:hypothetical protein